MPAFLGRDRACHLKAPAQLGFIGRVGSATPRRGFPFENVSGGSSEVDPRALTIDRTARRGSPGPAPTVKSMKGPLMNSLNALGKGNSLDLSFVAARRHQDLVPGSMIRTKSEKLQGMPLTGRGADIDLACGRRCQGFPDIVQDRKSANFILDTVSIDHHCARRHFSAPPPSTIDSWKAEINHYKAAESYARLLGRPEYTQGKAWRSISCMRGRERSQSPVAASHVLKVSPSCAAHVPLGRADPATKVFNTSTTAGTLRSLVLGDWSTNASICLSESPRPAHDSSQSFQEISPQSSPCGSPPNDSPTSQMRVIRKKADLSWFSDSTSTTDSSAPRNLSTPSSSSGSLSSSSPNMGFRSIEKNQMIPEERCRLKQDRGRQPKWKSVQPDELRKAQLRAGWH